MSDPKKEGISGNLPGGSDSNNAGVLEACCGVVSCGGFSSLGVKVLEGQIVVRDLKLALVAARWNGLVTERLIEGSVSAFKAHGGCAENLTLCRVPGCFEIPVVCQKLAMSKKYDGIVVLGTLLKGATDHYDVICSNLSGGVAQVVANFQIPVTLGVIFAANMEQALDRAGGKMGNKGWEATISLIETINVMRLIP